MQQHYNSHWKKLISHSILAISIIIFGYICRYLANVLLARYLHAEAYGDFSVIFNIMLFGAIGLLLGMDDATLKFIPEYIADKKWRYVAGYLKRNTIIIKLTSLISIFLGMLATFILFLFIRTGYTILNIYYPYALTLWIIPLLAIITFQTKLLRSLRYLTWSLLFYNVFPYILFALGIILAIQTHTEITLLRSVLIFGIGLLLVSIAQYSFIKIALPQEIRSHEPMFLNKRWFTVSIHLMISNLVFVGISSIDLIILEILGHSEVEVGIFAAILVIANSMLLINISINIIISPLIAILAKRKAQLQSLANMTNWLLTFPTLIMAILIIAFGKTLLSHFGHDFSQGYYVLVIVICGYVVAISTNLSSVLLKYTEHQRATVNINMLALLIMIVIELFSVPRYGFYGAAIGLAVARCLICILNIYTAKNFLKMRSFFFV